MTKNYFISMISIWPVVVIGGQSIFELHMGKGDHSGVLSKGDMTIEHPVSGFIPCHTPHDYCFIQTVKYFKAHHAGWQQGKNPLSNMKIEDNMQLHRERSVLHAWWTGLLGTQHFTNTIIRVTMKSSQLWWSCQNTFIKIVYIYIRSL